MPRNVRKSPLQLWVSNVGPWISVATFLGGTVWGLYQYTERNTAERVAETLKFVREFQTVKVPGGNVAEATLRDAHFAINEKIANVGAKLALESEAQMPCEGVDCLCPKRDFPACLDAETKQISIGNAAQVKALNHFFDALAFCALEKTCDPEATASYFGSAMFGFVQNHCTYFEKQQQIWRTEEPDDARIVQFLLKHHFPRLQVLPKRKYWMRCVKHRDMETVARGLRGFATVQGASIGAAAGRRSRLQ